MPHRDRSEPILEMSKRTKYRNKAKKILPSKREMLLEVAAQLFMRTRVGENNCWEWVGSLSPHGYGLFHYQRANRFAHRITWELFKGPIPFGKHIHHQCENRKCVNPAHLECVSPLEHFNKHPESPIYKLKLRTHCNQGHPYIISNLKPRKGARRCRICANIAVKKHRKIHGRTDRPWTQ